MMSSGMVLHCANKSFRDLRSMYSNAIRIDEACEETKVGRWDGVTVFDSSKF
jgi:hypothetical protein